MNKQLELAILTAIEAHSGQFDKAGEPYYKHPEAVAAMMSTEEGQMAGWLHDVLEDTKVTLKDLYELGFPDEVINAVFIVTRQTLNGKKETYSEFIRRIKQSGNALAIKLKLADLVHNSSPERIAKLPPEGRSIVKRYDKAKKALLKRP